MTTNYASLLARNNAGFQSNVVTAQKPRTVGSGILSHPTTAFTNPQAKQLTQYSFEGQGFKFNSHA